VTVEDTTSYNLKVSAAKLTKFDNEIRRFDAVMDRILKVIPEDLKVWDRIAEVRDAVFRLQQQLRGCEIAVFAEPWIDPDEMGFPYESPADIFWDRKKQQAYDEEVDEGLEEDGL
jgi:hypothetical protein